MSNYPTWAYHACGAGVNIFAPVIILRPENLSLGDGVRVDSMVKIEAGEGMTIGDYVHIASFAHLGIGGGRLTIGQRTAVSSGARILTATATPESYSMSAAAPREEQFVVRKHTIIGECALIGAGAIIMPGVTVGDGAVVGAGAVVTKDVEPWTVVVGVPARKLRDREEGKAKA